MTLDQDASKRGQQEASGIVTPYDLRSCPDVQEQGYNFGNKADSSDTNVKQSLEAISKVK